jgi:hypothetical protein
MSDTRELFLKDVPAKRGIFTRAIGKPQPLPVILIYIQYK